MKCFLAVILVFVCTGARGAEHVKLQLNWVPEPEFGGIFAAKLNGIFKTHGLNVTINAGGAGTATWQLVAKGNVEFGVASADEVIIARKRGADIVAVFATYQTCPQGLMTHASRGLKELADVFKNDGTLAVEPGLAYVSFLKNKYGFDKLKVVSYDGGIGTFLNDKNFTQQCFVTSEPLAAKKAGSDPQVFLVADSGYNPYTAVIITRGDYAREHAEQVKQMAAALREGWRAYLDDPTRTNETMEKVNPDMDPATFAAAAEAQKPLIETEETKKLGLGAMTKQRWEALGKQLVELKVVDQAPPPAECFIEWENRP